MKFKCDICGEKLTDDHIPTCPECGTAECPHCGKKDHIMPVCEHEGCEDTATCGRPSKDGQNYYRLCGKHYSEYEKERGSEIC
jgi:hypothetical protein